MKHDEKKCSRCGKIKKYWEFNKNSSSPDGLYSRCRVCSRELSREHYYSVAKFRKKTPEQKAQKVKAEYERRRKNPYLRVAENHRALARKIGIDYNVLEKHYERQFMKQQAHCAICGRVTEELCIDHNHTTNHLRGLLCRDCNYGIGCFKDDVSFLSKGADYLASYVN